MRHVHLVALLPPARLNRLRLADRECFQIAAATDWADVVNIIRRRPVEIVVADPLFGGRPQVYEIERLRLLFPSLPVLAYTTLDPEVGRILLVLGRLQVRRALFERFDDAPGALRAAIRDELEQGAVRQVMQALHPQLAQLPDSLRWALEEGMLVPESAATVADLAKRAHVSRRSCERAFARATLPSPAGMIRIARLLYAHRLLLDPGYTVEDVARRLGFGRARALQTGFREVFGLSAGDLRISLSFDAALAHVTARHFSRAEQKAS